MIGAGNTATVLSKLMVQNGHNIIQVLSRNLNHAETLASTCNAESSSLIDTISPVGDLYIIALSDTAIGSVKKINGLKDKIICHTAGSVSIEALKGISDKYGVLYPLQSLSKLNETIPEIPFLVDGNNEETRKFIFEFAKTLSKNVSVAYDSDRLKYHISAVFVHNFANHIFALSEKYCESENIDFRNLFPLMNELIHKVEQFGALKSQTGPAIRKDDITIQKHLDILSSHSQMKKLYRLLTDSIIKLNDKDALNKN